ncbi:hypothetical protein E2C01_092409 [Portunus trituberculatus]|uniref:Uncharacterized protein n=1 Tax=Portunus trituberculatus TaxID=210409 RepID=A0A5B7JRY9_PORTR|nr:hypothetical protein [Portunus trituberculatus]
MIVQSCAQRLEKLKTPSLLIIAQFRTITPPHPETAATVTSGFPHFAFPRFSLSSPPEAKTNTKWVSCAPTA